MPFLGAIMAGGESRRMGADKAELKLAGIPLWRRQEQVLWGAGADAVVLIRRPGQPAPVGLPCCRDTYPDVGPLAGLQAALSAGTAEQVAVLAVDMPGIDPGWFHWLLRFCRPGRGAMARHGEACEPLAAIYPIEALGEIEFRLRRGEHSLQSLALALATQGRLALVPLPAEFAPAVRSLNRPEDWEDFSRRSGAPKFSVTVRHSPMKVSSPSERRRSLRWTTPQRRLSCRRPRGNDTRAPLSNSARATQGARTPTPRPIFTSSLIASMLPSSMKWPSGSPSSRKYWLTSRKVKLALL